MTAFVLAGEGAKGAYHSGIIKKLEEQGIKPKALYGVSSGSMVAPLYAHAGSDFL